MKESEYKVGDIVVYSREYGTSYSEDLVGKIVLAGVGGMNYRVSCLKDKSSGMVGDIPTWSVWTNEEIAKNAGGKILGLATEKDILKYELERLGR